MTNETETVRPVLPSELNTPNLAPEEHFKLWGALNLAQAGVRVFAACTYPKQTDSPPRVEGEHYTALPGVSSSAQFGPIVRVFRRKDDNLVRFTIWSLTRWGFTTIIPDGLTAFTFMPPPDVPLFQPQSDQTGV